MICMHCIRFEANTEHNFIAAVVACFTRTLICTLFLSFILCVRATVYNTSCSHSFHTIRRCRRRRRARLFRYINSIVDSTPSRSYQPFSRGEIALRNNFFLLPMPVSPASQCLPCFFVCSVCCFHFNYYTAAAAVFIRLLANCCVNVIHDFLLGKVYNNVRQIVYFYAPLTHSRRNIIAQGPKKDPKS